MVTRNWYNYFKATRVRKRIPDGVKLENGSTTYAGWNSTVSSDAITHYCGNVQLSTSQAGVILGSGSTPATFDDYKLESQITTGLSGTTVNSADEDYNRVSTITLTNTSGGSITIGEIGIRAFIYTGENSSSMSVALIERTVLDTPVTIEPGGVGQVTYTISMNYPTE